MSLLPYIVDDLFRPSRIHDQHFGLGLDPEDLLAPITLPSSHVALMRRPFGYIRPWKSQASRNDVGSTVSLDNNKFTVNLDVQQFAPEEITVKATGENTITIEAKHEEKEDEHGFIYRHFVRKYILPKGHDINHVKSSLSSDGVLTITAPKIDAKQLEHREIPVNQTGVPARKEKEAAEKMEVSK